MTQFSTETQPPDDAFVPSVPVGYRTHVLRLFRRVLVFVLGTSVVAVGIVMIVSPGPAVVVIPLGLGILATEFLWARRILDSLKHRLVAAHTSASQANLPGWVRCVMRCTSASRAESRELNGRTPPAPPS